MYEELFVWVVRNLTMMTSFGNNRIHMIFVATPLAIHLSHTPSYTETCIFRRHTMSVAKVFCERN